MPRALNVRRDVDALIVTDEIVDLKNTSIIESGMRYIDIKLYQGQDEKKDEGLITRVRDDKCKSL